MRKFLTNITATIKPTRALLSLVCLAFLAASLLGIGPSATAQDQTDDILFETPEDAITFYMEAVTEGDISQILQACAINEMSAGFSFDLFIDYVGYLTIPTPAPSDYPFYEELNRAKFTQDILNQVQNLAYGLLATENGIAEGRAVPMDLEGATQFREEVNPARLAQLQVMAIGVPEPELASNERTVNIWNRNAQIYGADEYTERVVLFQFEGDTYTIGFQLLRYGDNWKISRAASALGNTPATGAPQATTEEEFQALVGGD